MNSCWALKIRAHGLPNDRKSGLCAGRAQEGLRTAKSVPARTAPMRRDPRSDDNFDDNRDDNRCLNDARYTAICGLSCLVTASARSWQCGGHGFESR